MPVLGSVTLVVTLVLFLVGATFSKKTKAPSRFMSDQDEIWQECSSSKYASIDGVRFSILRHTFKMAAMTSFHAKKYYHRVITQAASAWHICSSVRQFLV